MGPIVFRSKPNVGVHLKPMLLTYSPTTILVLVSLVVHTGNQWPGYVEVAGSDIERRRHYPHAPA